MAQNKFQIVFMDEAKNFVKSIPAPAREKLYYNFDKVSCGFSSSELFKKLDGDSDLYEFRTLYNGLQYRFLAFWDEQKKRLVVVTHGLVKKTWKIPAKEIERAKSLRNKYYESK